MFALRGFFLQAIGVGARLGVEGILLLYLNHQIGSAAEIQPEVDVFLPIGDQLALAPRNADDAVEADQDDGDDE